MIALGAGLGVWGVINLLEGYGNDNPGAKYPAALHVNKEVIWMKSQNLTVLCRYAEEETNIDRIIQSSFAAFLKKELQNISRL